MGTALVSTADTSVNVVNHDRADLVLGYFATRDKTLPASPDGRLCVRP